MKIQAPHLSIAAMFVVAFTIMPVAAEELRLGAKVGYFDIDFDQYEQEKAFMATGVQIGYEYLTTNSIALSAEAEFVSSLTEGEAENDDFSYQSVGLFAGLRTRGRIFFVGRLGYISAQADFENRPTVDDDAAVISAGIGFGKQTRREIMIDSISYTDNHSALFLSFGLSF